MNDYWLSGPLVVFTALVNAYVFTRTPPTAGQHLVAVALCALTALAGVTYAAWWVDILLAAGWAVLMSVHLYCWRRAARRFDS